jgi:hypothetical protein
LNTLSGSAAKPSATETVDFGVSADTFLVVENGYAPWGHLIRIRPDYLFDLQDDSRIASLNIQYVPTVNTLVRIGSGESAFGLSLNTYRPLWPGVVFLKPMLDFRIDSGFYTDRGLAAVAASHQDFFRLGGQTGLSLLSATDAFPIALSTAYTGLYGAIGQRNIGYFANSLSFNVAPYITPTVTYSNGTREDTAKREQLWQVGLSFRY